MLRFFLFIMLLLSFSILEAKEQENLNFNTKVLSLEKEIWAPKLKVNPQDYYEEYQILNISSVSDTIEPTFPLKSAQHRKKEEKSKN